MSAAIIWCLINSIFLPNFGGMKWGKSIICYQSIYPHQRNMKSNAKIFLKYISICLFLTSLLFITTSGSVHAQGTLCDPNGNLMVNSSFELPVIPNNSWSPRLETTVPGWDTDDPTNRIEIWNSPFLGVQSFQGDQHAELNYINNTALYQDIPTVPGTTVTWQLGHRGRAGVDTMSLRFGPPNATVEIDQFSTGRAWRLYNGNYTIPPGQTVTRFEFRAISSANGNPGIGNLLDAMAFGVLCDHGDAPAIYPNAAHVIDGVYFLGTDIDYETGSLPNATATGDDNDTSDDEDGVILPAIILADNPLNVSVQASRNGFLDAWIDYNADGDWDDPGEQVFNTQALVAGVNILPFTPPIGLTDGLSFARFRFSAAGGLTPSSDANEGEVEDYQVTLEHSRPTLSKSFNPTVVAIGESSTLTILINNNIVGAANLTNLGLIDTLPANGRI